MLGTLIIIAQYWYDICIYLLVKSLFLVTNPMNFLKDWVLGNNSLRLM